MIPSDYRIIDVQTLSQLIVKHHVNKIACSTALVNELNKFNRLDPSVRYTIHTGGDVLKEEYIDNLQQFAQLYNGYGPTETTVCCNNL